MYARHILRTCIRIDARANGQEAPPTAKTANPPAFNALLQFELVLSMPCKHKDVILPVFA